METQDLQTWPFQTWTQAHSDASQLKLNMASIGGREIVPLVGKEGQVKGQTWSPETGQRVVSQGAINSL